MRKYVVLRHSGPAWVEMPPFTMTPFQSGDASFHHDILPECLWPSSSEYSSSETNGGIAS